MGLPKASTAETLNPTTLPAKATFVRLKAKATGAVLTVTVALLVSEPLLVSVAVKVAPPESQERNLGGSGAAVKSCVGGQHRVGVAAGECSGAVVVDNKVAPQVRRFHRSRNRHAWATSAGNPMNGKLRRRPDFDADCVLVPVMLEMSKSLAVRVVPPAVKRVMLNTPTPADRPQARQLRLALAANSSRPA